MKGVPELVAGFVKEFDKNKDNNGTAMCQSWYKFLCGLEFIVDRAFL